MDTPTYNAEQQAVWKPQPGEYWEGGLRYAQSYGGIVSALQDRQAYKGDKVKAYPNNFAGIIAAIEDLQNFEVEAGLPNVGAPPPGWEIIINPDGSVDGGWQQPPADGTLWFDTRQGRLFIAIDEQWIQTNGGDGIAHVGPNPPTNPPVIGQTWLDTVNGLFYVYIGEGKWQAVVSDGDITVTTATLPLSVTRSTSTDLYEPQILPEFPSIADMQVQKDYNDWVLSSLVSLDKALTEDSVFIDKTPPTENVIPGTLWFNSTTLELSIYYEDDNIKQWVPANPVFRYDEQLTHLNAAIAEETVTRQNAITSLRSDLIQRLENGAGEDEEARQRLDALEADVASIERISSEGLMRKVHLDAAKQSLQQAIDNVRSDIPSITHLQSQSAAEQTTADLQAQIAGLATSTSLQEVRESIPSIDDLAKSVDVTAEISAATEPFVPSTGGRFTGTIQMDKLDVSKPGFDFSTQVGSGDNAFVFKTNAPREEYTSFGTTENWWEYAWKFESQEDFCWIFNEREKVFSITKDGPACSTLILGDIQDNAEYGRVIYNSIDLKERLVKYQKAFEEMRRGVATSTDFDSLKASLITALAHV
nr:hypothetical protein 11 [bacterium]BDD46708.1 hypothetical protein 19 [Paracoccaceae bacterium]